MNKLIALAFSSIVLIAFQKKGTDWKALVPLVTDQIEVHAILGAPVYRKNNIYTYETPEEKITVWYGAGKSIGKDVCCWKVANEVLFKFVLAPKRVVPLSQVDIDLTGFTKQKAHEMVNDYYYYNENDGVTITTRFVEEVEVLLSIERGPNHAQRKGHCRKADC